MIRCGWRRDAPGKSGMDAKTDLGSKDFVASLPAALNVNGNWKSPNAPLTNYRLAM